MRKTIIVLSTALLLGGCSNAAITTSKEAATSNSNTHSIRLHAD